LTNRAAKMREMPIQYDQHRGRLSERRRTLHFEWALKQHFANRLAAGVGGYLYQQITDDGGSGDRIGPFRGRDVAAGPLLESGTQEVTVSGRWFREFDVQHRVQGDLILLSSASHAISLQDNSLKLGTGNYFEQTEKGQRENAQNREYGAISFILCESAHAQKNAFRSKL
jgi:hypothetical protein